MKTQKANPFNANALRARARKEVRRRQKNRPVSATSPEQRSVEELQIHEVELQMQNEELKSTQLELENACERFSNLYDFAPCAYITLDAEGKIREANLVAASLLNTERGSLINQKFTQFIRSDFQDTFYLFCRRLLTSKARETTELELKSKTENKVTVRLDGVNESPLYVIPIGVRP